MKAKIETSAGFRSVSKIIIVCHVYFKFQCSAPSFSTGLLWVKKLGYYQLQQPKEQADDWIIIADESIGIGQEKLLVVLGIRRCNIDFLRPLQLQDLKPILVKSKEKWTGDDIAKELKTVKKQLGEILYAVTDAGSTLKKGLKNSDIKHVYDITHAIAICLEKIYKNDTEFQEYTNLMGQMRFKKCCSKYAHLIPPNQRSKSRFLNIDIITNWGIKVLRALEKNDASEDEKGQLLWVKEKEGLIVEMDKIMEVIRQISIILKSGGLSKKNKRKCISILKTCKKDRMRKFREYFINYLNNNAVHIDKRGEKLLCCSDVIESTFGKYKNEISKNLMTGITDLALIIPAFTSDLSEEEINKAIDYCTIKDIKQWSKTNLCESLSVKRNAILKKVERK
ncbi:MAG: hypothetical protein J7J86_01080 [Bacteroidales bacterium]|nr:hypothetical protein [Bacteroidales bacterium]